LTGAAFRVIVSAVMAAMLFLDSLRGTGRAAIGCPKPTRNQVEGI
jgi:hypothetical protein